MLFASALHAAPAPQTFEDIKRHTLERFSYGPTAEDLSSIQTALDLRNWFNGQLGAPGALDPMDEVPWIRDNCNRFQPLEAFPPISWYTDSLEHMQLYLAINSDHQLREVMTYFWESLFSTNTRQISGNNAQLSNGMSGYTDERVGLQTFGYLYQENETYRSLALTSFDEILHASFEAAAMRTYLNMSAMYFGDANEDYARELLELHTLGPINADEVANYNPVDINAMAQLLTGRGVDWDTGAPLFNPSNHNPPLPSTQGGKYMFDDPNNTTVARFEVIAETYPGENMDRLLDHLVQQTQTKHYICNRLIEYFIGEPVDVNSSLMAACLVAWDAGSGNGDIKEILRAIWQSPDFIQSVNGEQRVKSPMEFAVSQARLFGGEVHGIAGRQATSLKRTTQFMWSAGQRLFLHPSPDGYSIKSTDQVSTAAHYQRYEFASVIGSPVTVIQFEELQFDLRGLAVALVAADTALSFSNHVDVAEALLRHGLGSNFGSLERARVEAYLDAGLGMVPGTWDPAASDSTTRIELACAYIAALPQSFQK